MRKSLDPDATSAARALRLYQKLLLDGRRHYLGDLAQYLSCSPQTVLRLIAEIEALVGPALATGLSGRRRWYQIRSISRNRLGLEFEELRYLAICRDLSGPYLPEQVRRRVDQSLFNFSMLMADQEYAEREKAQKQQIGYCAKGWIDYTPWFGRLEQLVAAMDEKRFCLIRYQALGKRQPREHKVAIGRLVCMNGAIYALGALAGPTPLQRGALINLAVQRIKSLRLTESRWDFVIPHEDLALFGLPWHEPRLYRIRFKTERVAQYVRERIWSAEQRLIDEPEGSLILELVSRSGPEVAAWVRSFGDDAELLSESAANDGNNASGRIDA